MSVTEIIKTIADEEGQALFLKTFSDEKYDGKSKDVKIAYSYAALEKRGYQEIDGQWVRETAWDKFKKLFVLPEERAEIAEKLDEENTDDPDDTDKKNKKPHKKQLEELDNWTLEADVVKIEEEQRLVFGWASVIEEDGEAVVDKHGDVIEPAELVNAAQNFVSDFRKAKAMHMGAPIGEIVESLVFTDDVQKALGINLKKVGWFIGMKVHDDKIWKAFKSGELAAFSIGGFGEREET